MSSFCSLALVCFGASPTATDPSITSPETDHRPTDVIFTFADVPNKLSGAITSTWIYPLVCPTCAGKDHFREHNQQLVTRIECTYQVNTISRNLGDPDPLYFAFHSLVW